MPEVEANLLDPLYFLRHHVLMGDARLSACALFALLYVGLLGPCVASAQRPSFGPLTSEEGSPLQRISYTAMMEDTEVVRPGALSIEVWNGFSNIFEQDSSSTHVLFLDLARLFSTVTLRWGSDGAPRKRSSSESEWHSKPRAPVSWMA